MSFTRLFYLILTLTAFYSSSLIFPILVFASGTWSSLPSFTQRKNHKTTLLDTNKILSIGGETTIPINWVEQLTFESNNWVWSFKPDIPIGRSSHTVTKLNNGNVLVTGGSGTSGGIQNTAQIYNSTNNTWLPAGLMHSRRAAHSATLLHSGNIFVVGGIRTGSIATNSAEILDPSLTPYAWELKSPLPAIRGAHTATLVTLNGKEYLLIAGGGNGTANLKSTNLYDIENDLWIEGPSMSTTRVRHTATLLNDGRVLIVGGPWNTAEIWSPLTNTFTNVAQMTYNRTNHTTELLNDGRVIIMGGYGSQVNIPGNSILKTVEIYDPITNTWTLDTPMTTARMDHASTKLDDGRIVVSGGASLSGNTGTTEIYTPEIISPSPTPTDTPTPTPTPSGPQPFLDLPWDYSANNMTFNEAALSMKSIFDHEYPLISIGTSNEPIAAQSKVTGFDGKQYEFYSGHDGYDWGRAARTKYGVSVLAAAAGTATFVNTCTPCGNQIRIDHNNGFQTRYYHLDGEDLLTNNPDETIEVIKGQKIGKVGFTGNIDPPNSTGSHIHFMVVEDKDNDGNFNDNIPDGLTDPFGWQSTTNDPWENYSFNYLDLPHTGNISNYLWSKKLDSLNTNISTAGGIFTSGKTKIVLPQNAVSSTGTLKLDSRPNTKINNTLESIGSIIEITAKDAQNNPITLLNSPLSLIFDFSSADMKFYKLATLAIYSSTDGNDWIKESTSIDLENKLASALIGHLTQFALVGELADTTPPVTTISFTGEKGVGNNFRSNVTLILTGNDVDGLGVENTFYRLHESEGWQEYTTPLDFTDEGSHQIQYFSIDELENTENIKTTNFNIDKTFPEIRGQFQPSENDFIFSGEDSAVILPVIQTTLTEFSSEISTADDAGNTTKLLINKNNQNKNISISIYSIQYNTLPAMPITPNRLFINYSKEDIILKHLLQTLYIENETSLLLNYHSQKSITEITNRATDTSSLLPGIHLLKLYTDKGELKYTF